MEPNINQSLEANTPPTPAPASAPENPESKNSKVIILLVILLLLAVGMAAYILFAKNQMNNNQKSAAGNSNAAVLSPTLSPTLTPEEDLKISSPEADLLDLEADVKGL